MSFSGKWMKLEIIMLSEIRQAQKAKYCTFLLICRISKQRAFCFEKRGFSRVRAVLKPLKGLVLLRVAEKGKMCLLQGGR
jgi:hypothetical protein